MTKTKTTKTGELLKETFPAIRELRDILNKLSNRRRFNKDLAYATLQNVGTLAALEEFQQTIDKEKQ